MIYYCEVTAKLSFVIILNKESLVFGTFRFKRALDFIFVQMVVGLDRISWINFMKDLIILNNI